MVSTIRVLVIMLIFLVGYVFYIFFLRTGEVHKIYQHTDDYSDVWKRKCKSTAVLVDDAPLSHHALKRMWLRNSKKIIDEWKPLTHECDDVFFVRNKLKQPDYHNDLNYWLGDDDICLNGVLGKEQCISKEEQLFILQLRASTSEDKPVGEINGKTVYIHFIDY
jgi:hypothetical protein